MAREYIHAVEFGVFSPEEIRRMSVCSVTESGMYSASLPASNSSVDFRMGSVRTAAAYRCSSAV
jgi:DNA-directed RNA polymerase beta' subunit